MDFRELQYILAIARHLNITRAAEELYVSQPTLSKFIQKLETEIGQPLFKRIGNRFALTYAGEVYVEKAKHILELKKSLDSELADIIQNDRGELNVAFPTMRGTYMLPDTLPIFRERFPHVKVNVFESNSTTIDDLLLQGDVDIAFYNLTRVHPSLEYEVIRREEIVLVASGSNPVCQFAQDHTDCRYPWLPLDAIADQLCILTSRRQRTRQIVEHLLDENNIELRQVMEISNILAGIQLAARGYGVTFTSECHLRHMQLPEGTRIFSVGNPNVSFDFVAASRKGLYLSSYAQSFISIVTQCY